MERYVIRLRDQRTGEWFRRRVFESFQAAALYGDCLDDRRWSWSIAPL